MADNTVMNAGVGGDTLRTVQKGTPKTPASVIDIGAGTTETLLSAGQKVMAASVPVVLASDQTLPLPAGAAADATLAALSGKVTACNTGAVVVSTLPALAAGANFVGKVAAGQQTDAVYNGVTALTPKFAALNAAASGDGNTVVAAVTGKKLRVLSYSGNVAGAVTAKFRSFNGASTYTDLTGPMALLANQPIPGGSYCPVGLFETAAGEALTLNLSAAVQASGRITYVEV